ncbi:hypothetical protein ACJW30_06G051700 [Castanea mollissima]
MRSTCWKLKSQVSDCISEYFTRKAISRAKIEKSEIIDHQNNEGQKEDLELPFFELSTIVCATDNFSFNNKLGERWFWICLQDNQEIVVKRLSRSFKQGLNELKNEVRLIAKLQHRNLVKLLGCCIQQEEKNWIYEYMPNKSLDYFIFDQTKGKLLDWSKRFCVICGISQGLQYLHQDSRFGIIHRDLKSSNVSLDGVTNSKILDFVMARTFGGDYFGILLLEIISGKKSRGFYHPNHKHNLIGHAWILWNEGRPLELIDECLGESCTMSEVLRCIHLSLLCVQHECALTKPKQPGFFLEKDSNGAQFFSSNHESSSTNEITVTLLEPH